MIHRRTILKVLCLLLLTGFLCIIYFTLEKKSFSSSINEKNYHYEAKDEYFQLQNNPISTAIKVIPVPKSTYYKHSVLLLLSNSFRIISKQNNSNDLQLAINRYSRYISLLTESLENTNQTATSSENILIIDCPSIPSKQNQYPKLGEDESYALNITKIGAFLYASSLTGVIRGLSTFVQLIEPHTSSQTNYVPLVSIIDQPRFSWRGLMLDVSRHWMSVSVIERTLNAMELSKLNVLHLHLSDDQGFRVESLQYPLLHDRKEYFTQKDIHHLVEYARQRRIRIVPEFDIPGHTTSWFAGYPELATEPGSYQVETRWGVMKATMDPTKETTYVFLNNFFKEMAELFPDPYFHIGGDEVEGSQWRQSRAIQKFIKEHQLKSTHGLQAYFNRRIQSMLKKHDKIMIGWEEILDEVSEKLAVDKDAIIQSWKSRKSLMNTIDKGYRGLLSNGYYLDYIEMSVFHYEVNPILDQELQSFNQEQRDRILGGEACMWTEMVWEKNIDSRIWPRALAIAERFWSPSSVNDQHFLYERLFRMNQLLDKMQFGLRHLSSYELRLQNLISHPDYKISLLHPLMILADVCEPRSYLIRQHTGRYSSTVPLTTFADALQSESELAWKLESPSIDDNRLRKTFETWSIIHLRLQDLFNVPDKVQNLRLWVQDIEKLSKNLAKTGRIGLRILDYNTKKIFHHDTNNSMNSWTLSHWISHHEKILNQLEYEVEEIRLAAVRPIRRLLKSIK